MSQEDNSNEDDQLDWMLNPYVVNFMKYQNMIQTKAEYLANLSPEEFMKTGFLPNFHYQRPENRNVEIHLEEAPVKEDPVPKFHVQDFFEYDQLESVVTESAQHHIPPKPDYTTGLPSAFRSRWLMLFGTELGRRLEIVKDSSSRDPVEAPCSSDSDSPSTSNVISAAETEKMRTVRVQAYLQYGPQQNDLRGWFSVLQEDVDGVRTHGTEISNTAVFRLVFEKLLDYTERFGDGKIAMIHATFFDQWNCPDNDFVFGEEHRKQWCFYKTGVKRYLVPVLMRYHFILLHFSVINRKIAVVVFDSAFFSNFVPIQKVKSFAVALYGKRFKKDMVDVIVAERDVIARQSINGCGIEVVRNAEFLLRKQNFDPRNLECTGQQDGTSDAHRERFAQELQPMVDASVRVWRELGKLKKSQICDQNQDQNQNQSTVEIEEEEGTWNDNDNDDDSDTVSDAFTVHDSSEDDSDSEDDSVIQDDEKDDDKDEQEDFQKTEICGENDQRCSTSPQLQSFNGHEFKGRKTVQTRSVRLSTRLMRTSQEPIESCADIQSCEEHQPSVITTDIDNEEEPTSPFHENEVVMKEVMQIPKVVEVLQDQKREELQNDVLPGSEEGLAKDEEFPDEFSCPPLPLTLPTRKRPRSACSSTSSSSNIKSPGSRKVDDVKCPKSVPRAEGLAENAELSDGFSCPPVRKLRKVTRSQEATDLDDKNLESILPDITPDFIPTNVGFVDEKLQSMFRRLSAMASWNVDHCSPIPKRINNGSCIFCRRKRSPVEWNEQLPNHLICCGFLDASGVQCNASFHFSCISVAQPVHGFDAQYLTLDRNLGQLNCSAHFCAQCFADGYQYSARHNELVKVAKEYRSFHRTCLPVGNRIDEYGQLKLFNFSKNVSFNGEHSPICSDCCLRFTPALLFSCQSCCNSFHKICSKSTDDKRCRRCQMDEQVEYGLIVMLFYNDTFVPGICGTWEELEEDDDLRKHKHFGIHGYCIVMILSTKEKVIEDLRAIMRIPPRFANNAFTSMRKYYDGSHPKELKVLRKHLSKREEKVPKFYRPDPILNCSYTFHESTLDSTTYGDGMRQIAETCQPRLFHSSISLSPYIPPKGRGVIATKDIKNGTVVAEYFGEVIGESEMKKRTILSERTEHLDLEASHYMYGVGIDFVSGKGANRRWYHEDAAIDGAKHHSIASFLNHSCEPNVKSEPRKGLITNAKGTVMVHGVMVQTIRDIAKGEELLVDYNWPVYDFLCYCGEDSCRNPSRPDWNLENV